MRERPRARVQAPDDALEQLHAVEHAVLARILEHHLVVLDQTHHKNHRLAWREMHWWRAYDGLAVLSSFLVRGFLVGGRLTGW